MQAVTYVYVIHLLFDLFLDLIFDFLPYGHVDGSYLGLFEHVNKLRDTHGIEVRRCLQRYYRDLRIHVITTFKDYGRRRRVYQLSIGQIMIGTHLALNGRCNQFISNFIIHVQGNGTVTRSNQALFFAFSGIFFVYFFILSSTLFGRVISRFVSSFDLYLYLGVRSRRIYSW